MSKTRDVRAHFLESVVLSVLGIGIYNCILQFVLYPSFSRTLGAESFGNVLTLLSVQSIFAISVGAGVSLARMANVPRFTTVNGDYDRFLLPGFAAVAAVGVGTLLYYGSGSKLSFALYPLLGIVTALRYYCAVAFRLEINYRKNFLFYLLLSLGYLGGLAVFHVCRYWELALLCGEAVAVAYTALRSPVLRPPFFEKSEHHAAVTRSCAALVSAQLFLYLTMHADRLLIGAVTDGTQVAIYYTASLLGKAMAMLTEPIAGVAIGFLARTKTFGRKQFLLASCAGVLLGLAAFVVMIPVSPRLIGLLYPDVAADASPYFLTANGGQIVYFIANLLLVVALRFMAEKYQTILNACYGAAFFALCTPALRVGGLPLFCKAVLLLNLLRLAATLLLGVHHAEKGCDKHGIG